MIMKNTIFGLLTLCIFSSVFSQNTISVKGSDTMLPLVQRLAEAFSKKNSSNAVSVTGGGSGVGIIALKDGNTDIAMSSRPIKLGEILKFEETKKVIKEKAIAIDPLNVIVHPTNKVNQLTRAQLEGIFTGRITNWKEVGGEDLKIIVYSRETSSGTYEFFKEHVLDKKEYASSALSMPTNNGIVKSISQTKGGIGYVGLIYANKTVKSLGVSFDGKTYVKPSIANAKNKTYPITRSLFYYYISSDFNKIKPFIDFVLSPEGQTMVSAVGYVTIK